MVIFLQGDSGVNGTKGIAGVDGRSGVPGQKVGIVSLRDKDMCRRSLVYFHREWKVQLV